MLQPQQATGRLQEYTWLDKDNVLHQAVRLTTDEARCGRRICVHCRYRGVRLARGSKCESSRKCDVCGLALCVNKRGCWEQFHQDLDQGMDYCKNEILKNAAKRARAEAME